MKNINNKIKVEFVDIPTEEFDKIETEILQSGYRQYGHISGEYLCIRLPKVSIVYRVKKKE